MQIEDVIDTLEFRRDRLVHMVNVGYEIYPVGFAYALRVGAARFYGAAVPDARDLGIVVMEICGPVEDFYYGGRRYDVNRGGGCACRWGGGSSRCHSGSRITIHIVRVVIPCIIILRIIGAIAAP
jgi:hypothetical protein